MIIPRVILYNNTELYFFADFRIFLQAGNMMEGGVASQSKVDYERSSFDYAFFVVAVLLSLVKNYQISAKISCWSKEIVS